MTNNNLTKTEKLDLEAIEYVYGDTSIQSIYETLSAAIGYDGNHHSIPVIKSLALKLYGVKVDYSKSNFGMF